MTLNSNVISEFYQKMYNNSIDIDYDISKMVTDNFWELVQCDVSQEDNTSSKTYDITEEQSKLLSDFKKTIRLQM